MNALFLNTKVLWCAQLLLNCSKQSKAIANGYEDWFRLNAFYDLVIGCVLCYIDGSLWVSQFNTQGIYHVFIFNNKTLRIINLRTYFNFKVTV